MANNIVSQYRLPEHEDVLRARLVLALLDDAESAGFMVELARHQFGLTWDELAPHLEYARSKYADYKSGESRELASWFATRDLDALVPAPVTVEEQQVHA